jgi:hypothetical protein
MPRRPIRRISGESPAAAIGLFAQALEGEQTQRCESMDAQLQRAHHVRQTVVIPTKHDAANPLDETAHLNPPWRYLCAV